MTEAQSKRRVLPLFFIVMMYFDMLIVFGTEIKGKIGNLSERIFI